MSFQQIDIQYAPALARRVSLRRGTSDRQVFADTFTGLYHLPSETMPSPQTVLDLGANIGLTAAHYRALWPDAAIAAVEMDEDCAQLAELNAPGVAVLQHAVTGRSGWGSYDPTVRAEAFRFDHAVTAGKQVLGLTTLRTIEKAFGEDTKVDFVKMDIEGAEWEVFQDTTWAPFVSHLLVELHPGGPDDLPDDTEVLLVAGALALEAVGFVVQRQGRHPRALWATRP